jgi:NADPH:quinone reductase-like Zn-dependent oxidoreductase
MAPQAVWEALPSSSPNGKEHASSVRLLAATLSFLRSISADVVINYRAQRFEDVVHGVDVVLDTVGEDTFDGSWDVLKAGGSLVTTVADVPEGKAKARGVRAQRLVAKADGKEPAQIAAIIDERHIKPIVTAVLPLAEARRAHEISESRHARGEIVLRVAEDPL